MNIDANENSCDKTTVIYSSKDALIQFRSHIFLGVLLLLFGELAEAGCQDEW